MVEIKIIPFNFFRQIQIKKKYFETHINHSHVFIATHKFKHR